MGYRWGSCTKEENLNFNWKIAMAPVGVIDYTKECEAGNIKSDYVMKLENITRYFGGLKGTGILASCFPPSSSVVKKKIAESKSISLITGRNLDIGIEDIFSK